MSIQFLGMIGHRLSSETIAPVGPIFDRDYIVRFAQTHEAAGFDRLLVGHWSDQPDGFLVTAPPDCRRRKFSTCWPIVPVLFPQPLPRANSLPLSTCWGPLGGAYHQRRQRCRAAPGWRLSRPRPALRPHRRLPRHRAPCVDQRAAGGYSQRFLSGRAGLVRHSPAAKPHLPIYFGGSSEAAIAVAGKHADVFALWGESLAQTGETIQRVRAEAAKHQRDIGFSVSFRPIIADSEAEAWRKPSISYTSPPSRRRSAGAGSKPNRRASAPSGCGLPRRWAEWWTNACGPASPSWWAADITPPRWWAPRSRWRMRCSTTTTSACVTS